MKKLAVIISILFSITVAANPIDDNCGQHADPAGAPVTQLPVTYVCHLNYAVAWRSDTRTSQYVTYQIDAADISGAVKRRDQFADDPDIPAEIDAALSDYAGSGYDRGHLSPAADNTASPEQMAQSFYLSNMLPQNPNQNRGAWRILEDRIRKLARTQNLVVTVGSHYEPGYETIGTNKVGVPQYIWKLVTDTDTGDSIAFWFVNQAVKTADIPDLVISISELERRTALTFSPDRTDAELDLTLWQDLLN
jgi:endonuclease G, mitochondrial